MFVYTVIMLFYKFCIIIKKIYLRTIYCASSHDSVAHYSAGDNSVEILSSGKVKVSLYFQP